MASGTTANNTNANGYQLINVSPVSSSVGSGSAAAFGRNSPAPSETASNNNYAKSRPISMGSGVSLHQQLSRQSTNASAAGVGFFFALSKSFKLKKTKCLFSVFLFFFSFQTKLVSLSIRLT
jgi:hypothetical protein